MTIEIRQLIIRAVVDERSAIAASPVHERPSPEPFFNQPAPAPERLAEDRQAIVSACVREVLRRLERARER